MPDRIDHVSGTQPEEMKTIAMYRTHLFLLPALFMLASLFCGCRSRGELHQSWRTFLRTPYRGVDRWLSEPIEVSLNYVPMWQLKEIKPLRLDVIPMLMLGQRATYELINIPRFKGTRRELFWQIHRRYNLVFDLVSQGDRVILRVRSPEFIRLMQ